MNKLILIKIILLGFLCSFSCKPLTNPPTYNSKNKIEIDESKDNKETDKSNTESKDKDNSEKKKPKEESKDNKENNSSEDKPSIEKNDDINNTKEEEQSNNNDKTLDPYTIVNRLTFEWKKDSGYQTEFDFDKLINKKELSKFNSSYLYKYINFYVNNFEGKRYNLTEEDIKALEIIDINVKRINELTSKLLFNISYKGIKKKEMISLIFKQNEYYASFFKISNDFAKEHYLEGYVDYISAFYQQFLIYDTERFVLIYKESHVNKKNNEISIKAYIMRPQYEDESENLAILEYTIGGFKSLQELKNDITISTTTSIEYFFKQKAKNKEWSNLNGDILKYLSKFNINTWIYRAKLEHKFNNNKKIELVLEDIKSNGEINKVLKANTSAIVDQDLKLINPKWKLKQAFKEGKSIKMVITLLYANDEELNIDFNLTISI